MKLFIAGGDGAGKSTLAKKIQSFTGYPIHSFARAMRFYISATENIEWETLVKKPTPPEIRKILRGVGEGERARLGADIWVKRFDQVFGDNPNYIVDDLRFVPELEYCEKVGGVSIYLDSKFDINVPTFQDLYEIRERTNIYVKEIRDLNDPLRWWEFFSRLEVRLWGLNSR